MTRARTSAIRTTSHSIARPKREGLVSCSDVIRLRAISLVTDETRQAPITRAVSASSFRLFDKDARRGSLIGAGAGGSGISDADRNITPGISGRAFIREGWIGMGKNPRRH